MQASVISNVRIVIVALLGALLMLGGSVARADAHAGHDHLDAEMQAALAAAPDEVNGRCTSTVAVEGLGQACATDDGLFRVKGRGGDSYTTHGADAPALASADSAAYAAASSTAVAGAGPDDIQCVAAPPAVKHTTLIYSYPSDQPSRFATVAPQLVQEAYKLSAFLRAESRSLTPTRGLKLLLECDAAGVPVVQQVQLATAGAADTFSTIVSDLKARGFGTSFSPAATDRQLVFHDSPVASGAAGTGNLSRDDRADVANGSNNGGMFAVEYAWSGAPHWDVLLHELAHTMGAVQASAAHATAAGHCNDGADVMCYADGSTDSAYSSTACSVKVFDCGRDDYFNPAPAVGSYLAMHWNVAAPSNLYLAQTVEAAAVPAAATPAKLATTTAVTIATGAGATKPRADTTAPVRVRMLPPQATTARSTTLRWRATTDNVAVTRYLVYRSTGRGWKYVGSTSAQAHAFTNTRLLAGHSYSYRLRARDAAGNLAAFSATVRVRTRR